MSTASQPVGRAVILYEQDGRRFMIPLRGAILRIDQHAEYSRSRQMFLSSTMFVECQGQTDGFEVWEDGADPFAPGAIGPDLAIE